MTPPVELCTVCDARFVAQALALERSLARTGGAHRLWVLCADAPSERVMRRRAAPETRVIPLAELERTDPDLVAVRAGRTSAEYAWTLKPSLCLAVLDRTGGSAVVAFVDADLWFAASPELLAGELGDADVLLVPHRHAVVAWTPTAARAWAAREDAKWGRYNSGSIAFRGEGGRAALAWWRERCLEWCFDRFAPGRWHEQKYLDAMPDRFRVRISEHPGIGHAPWNGHAHRLERRDGRLVVDGWPLVFHHFQSLALRRSTRLSRLGGRVDAAFAAPAGPLGRLEARVAPGWRLSDAERRLLYAPYAAELARCLAAAAGDAPEALAGVRAVTPREAAAGVVAHVAHRIHPLAGRVLPGAARERISRARAAPAATGRRRAA